MHPLFKFVPTVSFGDVIPQVKKQKLGPTVITNILGMVLRQFSAILQVCESHQNRIQFYKQSGSRTVSMNANEANWHGENG